MKTPADSRICSIEGCEDPAKGRGLCSRHYMRWYHANNPARIQGTSRRTHYRAPPAERELVAEIASICDVRSDKAERLAGYFELRLGGHDPVSARYQTGVSIATGNRYERWYEYFMERRTNADQDQ